MYSLSYHSLLGSVLEILPQPDHSMEGFDVHSAALAGETRFADGVSRHQSGCEMVSFIAYHSQL